MFTNTLHVLGVPHTVANKDYCSCAFTQKVVKFCKMMKPLGVNVIHYGHERSAVECTEHVTVTDDAILARAYGDYDWKAQGFKHNRADYAHVVYNANANLELLKRVRPGDLALCFWGWGDFDAVQGLGSDVKVVEPGIGYPDTFAKYRVFESYAIMHHIYGKQKTINPPWYDTVIPNYFDLDEFTYSAKPGDYFLCLSRKNVDKGIGIAAQVCEKIGAKLLVAGQGDLANIFGARIPACVTDIGFADMSTRRELLANAKALFLPTMYIEPFGGTVVEALISGTPVITTDWGVFNETNMHGVTGFRCRTFDHFVHAATHIGDIDRARCREWGLQYSLERVGPRYMEYFQSLDDLRTAEGWYRCHADRANAGWLER